MYSGKEMENTLAAHAEKKYMKSPITCDLCVQLGKKLRYLIENPRAI